MNRFHMLFESSGGLEENPRLRANFSLSSLFPHALIYILLFVCYHLILHDSESSWNTILDI